MAACMLFNEQSSCRNYRSVELGAGRTHNPQAKPLVVVLDPLPLCDVLVSLTYTAVYTLQRTGVSTGVMAKEQHPRRR